VHRGQSDPIQIMGYPMDPLSLTAALRRRSLFLFTLENPYRRVALTVIPELLCPSARPALLLLVTPPRKLLRENCSARIAELVHGSLSPASSIAPSTMD
jgi:hypothetical protein